MTWKNNCNTSSSKNRSLLFLLRNHTMILAESKWLYNFSLY